MPPKNKHHIPFNPARWPFFYGWVIVLAAIIGTIASLPGQTHGVSAFTEPLLSALSIDRTGFSLAYACGTIGSAMILTWGGRMYDKLGARATGVLGAVCLALVLCYLANLEHVAAALALPFKKSDSRQQLAAFCALVMGFFMLRFWGQGILTMVSRNMLMKWFEHRRGLANGIVGVFVPMAFSMTPLTFDQVVQKFGWQGAWFTMGMILFGVAAFSWVFFRDNPESCGLQPDGNLTRKPGDPQHHPDRQYTLPQARRTLAFWVFTLTIALHALYITALTLHLVSVFDSSGIGKSQAMLIFVPSTVITVCVAFPVGWISDHIRLKHLLFVLMTGMAISMVGALYLEHPFGYAMIILGNGIAGGTFGLLMTVTWPRFYGRKHLGAISGFHMSWVVAFSAIGPFLFGLVFKYTYTYQVAVALCLVFLAALFFLSLKTADPPAAPAR